MPRVSRSVEMLRARQDSGWLLPGLGARTAARSLERELALFGQLVGDWHIFPPSGIVGGEATVPPTGEVHVRWVLGGTAIQDTWGAIDPASRRMVPEGTTIRFYDEKLGAWRSTWISPYQRAVRRFIGRRVGTEIVLRELDAGARGEHWIFSEISPPSFRWRSEATPRGGRRRRITEEYRIVRATR
jgi:hypothetical protein